MNTPNAVIDAGAPGADAAPFWEAAREGRLLIKRCNACDRSHYYPRPRCPFCGSDDTAWQTTSGTGTLYAFSIVRNAPRPTAAVVVELPEGPRLTSVVVEADVHALKIGDAVVVRSMELTDGQVVPVFTTPLADEARAYTESASAAVQHVRGVPANMPLIDWRSAAVIGAGTMGSSIATALVRAEIPVCLIDESKEALARATSQVQKNLEAEVARKRLGSAQAQAAVERLRTSTHLEEVAGAALIVEAVWEQMNLKKTIFARLDQLADPDAVLATNTSTLDIDRIADATQRPGSVVGLHFFTPAHVMPLLEIVRGPRTRAEVVAAAQQLGQRLRKTAVVVGICDGFVGNRLMIAREKEAGRVLLEGATPQQVDRALREFGLPMGSFELADMTAGIELGWRMRQETGEKDPVVDRLVALGRLGQKVGMGYYRYEAGSRKPMPDSAVDALLATVSEELGIVRRSLSDSELIDRLILPMVNEGAKLVEEGIVSRPSDVDVVWQRGFGWPAYKGGPLFHADSVGLPQIHARLTALERVHGERFRPAALLTQLAEAGRTFSSLN